MDSLHEISLSYKTDKAEHTHYLNNYEKYFSPLRQLPIKLLELGVRDGGSLLMWRDYFPNGTIVGLDIDVVEIPDPSGRIHVYQGEQQDIEMLDKLVRETAPDGFDIIIDDCAHIGSLSRMSFAHLFPRHLKSDGIYVVEDWGTGYWNTWPDGYAPATIQPPLETTFLERVGYKLSQALHRKSLSFLSAPTLAIKRRVVASRSSSHNAGMVGFVKELIDQCAVEDIDHPKFGLAGGRTSDIKALHFSVSHVFIEKK